MANLLEHNLAKWLDPLKKHMFQVLITDLQPRVLSTRLRNFSLGMVV